MKSSPCVGSLCGAVIVVVLVFVVAGVADLVVVVAPDADAVGRVGEDDIAHIDSLDEQVARLTRELTASRS